MDQSWEEGRIGRAGATVSAQQNFTWIELSLIFLGLAANASLPIYQFDVPPICTGQYKCTKLV